MAYLNIDNYYKNSTKINMFRSVYAMEKIDGTSCHVKWDGEKLIFFSGCINHPAFCALFDYEALKAKFIEEYGALGEITIFGEGYGGKVQKGAWRYGEPIKFIAFDIKVGDNWLDVPSAERVCQKLGIEFVSYIEVENTIENLDRERDAPSIQAIRNGMGNDKPREGIVIRPLIEMRTSAENRVISKHKRVVERETKTPREPGEQVMLENAKAIAEEWVTPIRLEHVLSKMNSEGLVLAVENMREIIKRMNEDIMREGKGEISEDENLQGKIYSAIGTKTATLFKKRLSLIAAGREDLWAGFTNEQTKT
jgi:hypothetical protein